MPPVVVVGRRRHGHGHGHYGAAGSVQDEEADIVLVMGKILNENGRILSKILNNRPTYADFYVEVYQVTQAPRV